MAGDQRRCCPVPMHAFLKARGQRGQCRFAGQIDAGRIAALAINGGGQGDDRVRTAAKRTGFLHRIGNQLLNGDSLIPDAVDEAAVGAVFQQAPHQIGQQRLVGAHRRVDAARAVQLCRAHHLFVQRLTHAVQALEFVTAHGKIRAGHRVDRGQRVGIVGGKLREHRIARGEQFGGAGKVRHIGV